MIIIIKGRETILYKNVCVKILGPRFWQGIYLIQSLLLEHYF